MTNSDSEPTVKDRKGYLGGSDAAALLGVSPYGTILQVFADKVGSGVPRTPATPAEEQQLYFGNALEQAIGEAVQKYHGLRIVREPRFLRARDRPFMGGHIDFRIIGNSMSEDSFLECKNIRFAADKWGAASDIRPKHDNSSIIPVYYLAQLDHYMYVLEVRHCYIAALFGGSELRLYKVERDAQREATLLEAEDKMWERVLANDPPLDDLTYDDFCIALQQKYIKNISAAKAKKQDPVFLTIEQLLLLTRYRKAKNQRKRFEKEAKERRKEFIVSLGGKMGYFCDRNGEEVGSLLVFKRKGLDKDLFKIEYPDLYAQFEKESLFPKLKLAGDEDDD